MLFVKLKTFHNNSKRKMPTTPVKWVNLTAICVLLTVLLPSPANGFTPIGGLQNGEGRKLFGGYRITPKHCRGTKTLPSSDPRSNGPTICMFNHECAQRNGEVVGACMDGFLFGACCQVPLSNANENTLIKDAQNPFYQTGTHSTESYDSALYENNQKFVSNDFQDVQSSSIKYQDFKPTESSYATELDKQKIHTGSSTPSNSKIFYVNKGSVMVSSPSSLVHNDDYVMLSSSTSQSPYQGVYNRVSYTTELPTKIVTSSMDDDDSTQMPMILSETAEIKKNYSNGALDLDMGEFTHSDITHPGAETVLIDGDLQFSTGYGGPQSVYVPPPAHAEIIPPKRRPAQGPVRNGPSKKPINDKYVLIQTLEASKKPSQESGTSSTGISTNIDSIESIILMLNGSNQGPTYNVANTSPSYNHQKPLFVQNQEYGSTQRPYVPVTTVKPIVSVTTGSGIVLTEHISTTTPSPAYYEESDVKHPTTTHFQDTSAETNNKYQSMEMSDEKPSYQEISSVPQNFATEKIDVRPPIGPQQASYNTIQTQINSASNVNSQNDPSNPNYGYTSPGQPTSDFNKMPAVGEAYPVMDEEASAYFESSMLSQEQAIDQNNVAQTQTSSFPAQSLYDNNRPESEDSQKISSSQHLNLPSHHRPSSQLASQNHNVNPPIQPPSQVYQQFNNNKQTIQVSTEGYQQVGQTRPSSQDYQLVSQNRPIQPPPTQEPSQNYEPIVQNKPSSPKPAQNYEKISQSSYVSQPTTSHVHIRPTTQMLTTSFEVQSSPRPEDSQQNSEEIQGNYGQSTTTTQKAEITTSSSESSEAIQTPESQLIAQLTDRIKNGYLQNSRPSTHNIVPSNQNGDYLPRPTAQSVAVVMDSNNRIQAQAGYFSPSPNFEKVPTQQPDRISSINEGISSVRPTKPSTYSDIEKYSSSTHSTISSTSKPVSLSVRPSNRPTKRVTKRPPTQKKPSPNKQASQGSVPSKQDTKIVSTKPPLKKQPLSTSYVTGPTTPRPEVDAGLVSNSSPAPVADKVDTYISSSQSIYLANGNDEIILQNGGPSSNYHNNNKPLFVKIQSPTKKTPSPTIVITPKPTVVNLITVSTHSRLPSTTPASTSDSYIYSPLVSSRPDYISSTQGYVSIPQVNSNDFDDPGYSALYTPSPHPGQYSPTPAYPTFELPSDKYGNVNEEEEETYTSPNDFVNFPPVRNPNLNMSATASSVTTDLDLSTPAFVEDTILKNKMNTLVHKIAESLQDNFEALADMIDDNKNTDAGFSDTTPPATTTVTKRPSSRPTTRKPAAKPGNTSGPTKVSTKKPPTRISTPATTKKPAVTTKKTVTSTRKPTTKKPATRKPTRKVTVTSITPTISAEEEFDNEIDSEIGEENSANGRKFQCGVRPHVKSGRIVGGKGSTFGEFPWQVLVRESTWLGLFTKNKCGGVLITNKYVVTAAHCQPGFLASLVAVMGEHDISTDLESKRSVTKNVKRVIVHRQYDASTFENDLALLELESPVIFDSHIVPICMPPDSADFTGRMATVTGWGRMRYGGPVPTVLQEVQVPIIENSVCQEMFNTAGHVKKILKSFLCAGYANGQKDSCEGDSGGPLVLQRPDGRYELAGTVSHGIKCAAPYLPGVYMRTTYYKPWLKSITGVK